MVLEWRPGGQETVRETRGMAKGTPGSLFFFVFTKYDCSTLQVAAAVSMTIGLRDSFNISTKYYCDLQVFFTEYCAVGKP